MIKLIFLNNYFKVIFIIFLIDWLLILNFYYAKQVSSYVIKYNLIRIYWHLEVFFILSFDDEMYGKIIDFGNDHFKSYVS